MLKYLFIFFGAAMLFTACERGDVIDEGVTEGEGPEVIITETNPLVARGGGGEDGLDFICFTIDYPFGLITTTGDEITINNEDDLASLESGEVEIANFAYPLQVTLEDESSVVINNDDEIAELFANCVPDDVFSFEGFPAYQISEDNSCYELKYPITLTDTQGDEVTLDNEESFNAAVAEEVYFFTFPLILVDEDGNDVVVDDIEDMWDTLLDCNDWDWEYEGDTTGVWDWENGFDYLGCYQIAFPLGVIVDGETVIVNNHEDLCDLMLQGELEGYAYPLTLTDGEGNELVVNSEDELNEALAECWDGFELEDVTILLFSGSQSDSTNFEACYEINFPIQLDNEFLGERTIEDQNDFENAIFEEGYFCCIVYPVTINMTATGEEVTLQESSDVLAVLEDCY